jgi:tetratricopeptide (TPR) repeat protein
MVERFPDNYLGHFFLGKVHALEGREREAEKALRNTLQLEPDLEEPRYALIALYREAIDAHETVTVAGGESISVLCRNYYGRYTREIENALRRLNPEIKDFNTLAIGQKIRFPALELIDQPVKLRDMENKIIALYTELLQGNPRNHRAALELGYFYHQAGRRAQAAASLAELGAKSAADKEILRQVVVLYLDRKQYHAAWAIIEMMLRGAPQNADLRYLAGVTLDALEDKPGAMDQLRQVAPDSAFYSNAVVHIASLMQEGGKVAEAIAFLAEILERYPKNPDYYLYLGTLQEELEAYPQALEVLQRGLEIDPRNTALQFRVGVVLDKWGRKEESIAAMQAVVRLDPKHANALNYIGYTYAELGIELQEAERLIREALKIMPGDGYITDSLGWVFFKQGRHEEALEQLLKALERVPDDPVILEHVGDAYRTLGRNPKALEFYRRSLGKRTKPEEREALEIKIRDLSP